MIVTVIWIWCATCLNQPKDYSGFGQGEKQSGRTFVYLMILLKMVLLFQPSAFIHENVQRFPADFLHTVLSSLYHVEHYLMDPAQLTSLPVHRMRRYWICRLSSKLIMYKSLETVCKALSFTGGLTLDDLLVADIPTSSPLYSLTCSMKRSLQKFLSIAGDDEVYDLTQNAFKRKRSCSGKLMTITKGCSHLWVRCLGRKIWILVLKFVQYLLLS